MAFDSSSFEVPHRGSAQGWAAATACSMAPTPAVMLVIPCAGSCTAVTSASRAAYAESKKYGSSWREKETNKLMKLRQKVGGRENLVQIFSIQNHSSRNPKKKQMKAKNCQILQKVSQKWPNLAVFATKWQKKIACVPLYAVPGMNSVQLEKAFSEVWRQLLFWFFRNIPAYFGFYLSFALFQFIQVCCGMEYLPSLRGCLRQLPMSPVSTHGGDKFPRGDLSCRHLPRGQGRPSAVPGP